MNLKLSNDKKLCLVLYKNVSYVPMSNACAVVEKTFSLNCLIKSVGGVVSINRKFARSRASFNWEGTNPEIISPV